MRSYCAAKGRGISAGCGPGRRSSEPLREPTLRLRVFVGVEKESSGTVSANLNTPTGTREVRLSVGRFGLSV